jgi:hypothetical protein
MSFYFSKGNRLINSNTLIWSLPRITTCPGAGACRDWCYSTKAERMYKNVLPSRHRNYDFSQSDDFVPVITDFLRKNRRKIVRIHQAGDFYSQEYLNKWKNIARNVPYTRLYAFTKSHKLALWENQPRNFVLLQSYGSKYDELIDETKNTARVIWRLGHEQDHEYVCPHYMKQLGICGTECTYCFDEQPTPKHVALVKH